MHLWGQFKFMYYREPVGYSYITIVTIFSAVYVAIIFPSLKMLHAHANMVLIIKLYKVKLALSQLLLWQRKKPKWRFETNEIILEDDRLELIIKPNCYQVANAESGHGSQNIFWVVWKLLLEIMSGQWGEKP